MSKNERTRKELYLVRALLILMWKHCIERYYRPILTLIELSSSIIIFLMMYWKSYFFLQFSNELVGINKFERNMETVSHQTPSENHFQTTVPLNLINGTFSIIFAPETEKTTALMEKVAKELNISDNHGIRGTQSRRALEDLIIKNPWKPGQVYVEFKNVRKFDRHLNYEIKMKNFNNVNLEKESLHDDIEVQRSKFEEYHPFLRLQWAIDKSYLETKYGKPIVHRVYLNELPSSPVIYNMDNVFDSVWTANFCGLFLPFVFTMTRLVIERVSGVLELIHMTGVPKATIIISHFLNSLPVGLVFSLGGSFCLRFDTSGGFLPKIVTLVLFVVFFLHFLSIAMWAMLCSCMVTRKEHAVPLAVLFYVGMSSRNNYLVSIKLRAVRILFGLLPHVPFQFFIWELEELESTKEDFDIFYLIDNHSQKSLSVLLCCVLCVVQIIICFMATVYCSYVFPGKYGNPKRWDFLLMGSTEIIKSNEIVASEMRNSLYFEHPHHDKKTRVSIKNISKVYGENEVLKNVSFDIYKGEIVVLLGHNGAGKTTLMNIIAGMIPPTHGQIKIDGTLANRVVHRKVALCSQDNIFITTLNVMQHVIFFAMLKGESQERARETSKHLLEELGLLDKARKHSNQLHGSMKRRLQLACALSGGTSILVLDEPSTGLDLEMRRDLWNCLLALRASRTMLLSTHSLDEAETLADRIATLYQGELVCYATPFVLKSSIGNGYLLHLSSDSALEITYIDNIVTQRVPEAKLIYKNSTKSITYNLPMERSSIFPDLLSVLENNRHELGICSISVGRATLQEVFMKLCSSVDIKKDEEKIFPDKSVHFNLKKPPMLYLRQAKILWKRQILFLWSTCMNVIVFQVIIPIWYCSSSTYFLRNVNITSADDSNASQLLSPALFPISSPLLYLDTSDLDNNIRLVNQFSISEYELSKDIALDMKKMMETNTSLYKDVVAGLKIGRRKIQVFHRTSKSTSEAAGVALNMASNVISQMIAPADKEKIKITTSIRHFKNNNTEIDQEYIANMKKRMKQKMIEMAYWMLFVLIAFYATVMNVGTLITNELHYGTRRIHTMMGCPALLNWGLRLVLHVLIYTILVIMPIVIVSFTLDPSGILSSIEFALFFTAIMIVGLMSWLSFVYIMSFVCHEMLFPVLAVCIIVGLLLGFLEAIQDLHISPIGSVFSLITDLSGAVLPPHTMFSACLKAIHITCLNEFNQKTKNNKPHMSYYEWADDRLLPDLFKLGMQFCYRMALVILTEEGVFHPLSRLFVKVRKLRPRSYRDRNAMVEAQYVEKAINFPSCVKDDVLLYHKVCKMYRPIHILKPIHVLNNISFSVKKGECFGILGMNGAGKTTIFKTIVAETGVSRGKIWVDGKYLKVLKGTYLKGMNYCPQNLCVDFFLTGKQNLELLLTLRGFSDSDIQRQTKTWINIINLQKLSKMPVSMYSEGYRRQIAAACALCTGAPLICLDEPTVGVDVTAKRRIWQAARMALDHNQAILVASHNMDVIEDQCRRVAIVRNGEICAFGTIPELRAQHASGYSLWIKLIHNSDEYNVMLNSVKMKLKSQFKCHLQKVHGSRLHYLIEETISYSDLFRKVEELKAEYFYFIEEYTLNEMSLEDVFLSYTQYGLLRACSVLHGI